MTETRRMGALARKAAVYAVLVFAALFSVLPIAVMGLEGYSISLSRYIEPKQPFISTLIPFFNSGPTPAHYLDQLALNQFPARLVNTVAISAGSIAVALGAGTAVAYALARLPIRGKGAISYLLLALRALSPFAVVVPLYVIFTQDGLWNTYVGVALAEELAILPVVVLMLRGFFSDIPREVYDAAAVFGAGEGQIFKRVALRMVIPGMAVTAFFAFVLVWNEFAISSILTGPATKTVAVGVWTGLGKTAPPLRPLINFYDLNAGGFLAWIPAIAVMLGIRRYLAKGYSLGTASSNA
jgi:multiple sugar transport system permease protein